MSEKFEMVFNTTPVNGMIKPSRTPKIIAMGLAAALALAALSVPVDAFNDWRAEVAHEREQRALAEKREAEEQARAAEQRAKSIQRTREVLAERLDRASRNRVSAQSIYRQVLAISEAEDDGVSAKAALAALADHPIPDELLLESVPLDGVTDSDDDLATGKAPKHEAAINEFDEKTRQDLASYSQALRASYSAHVADLNKQAREQQAEAARARAEEQRRKVEEQRAAQAAEREAQRASRSRPASTPNAPAPVNNW